jgi:hypothetical protein
MWSMVEVNAGVPDVGRVHVGEPDDSGECSIGVGLTWKGEGGALPVSLAVDLTMEDAQRFASELLANTLEDGGAGPAFGSPGIEVCMAVGCPEVELNSISGGIDLSWPDKADQSSVDVHLALPEARALLDRLLEATLGGA